MDRLEQQNLRVNLGGVIALLSKNLYSSPGAAGADGTEVAR
jgi:molecular chaperone HtpG